MMLVTFPVDKIRAAESLPSWRKVVSADASMYQGLETEPVFSEFTKSVIKKGNYNEDISSITRPSGCDLH